VADIDGWDEGSDLTRSMFSDLAIEGSPAMVDSH